MIIITIIIIYPHLRTFLHCFPERGEEREKHGLVASQAHLDWGPYPQLSSYCMMLQPQSHIGQGHLLEIKSFQKDILHFLDSKGEEKILVMFFSFLLHMKCLNL